MGAASDVRVATFERLIDHAPLFPPASLELPAALREDRRARESASSFVLGRFVCLASRLGELPDVGRGVSAVLDAPLDEGARVEAVETPMPDDLDALARLGLEVYVELRLDDTLTDRLDAVEAHGLRAKVRCGGASTPGTGELARFVRSCRERRVVFKATAGLHHPVRTNGQHGLVNLLAAAVFGDEERALDEIDGDAFQLDAEAFRWRDRAADAGECARARHELLHSVGSCSFFEPVDELHALGMLPA